jgi:hypothetical protein
MMAAIFLFYQRHAAHRADGPSWGEWTFGGMCRGRIEEALKLALLTVTPVSVTLTRNRPRKTNKMNGKSFTNPVTTERRQRE